MPTIEGARTRSPSSTSAISTAADQNDGTGAQSIRDAAGAAPGRGVSSAALHLRKAQPTFPAAGDDTVDWENIRELPSPESVQIEVRESREQVRIVVDQMPSDIDPVAKIGINLIMADIFKQIQKGYIKNLDTMANKDCKFLVSLGKTSFASALKKFMGEVKERKNLYDDILTIHKSDASDRLPVFRRDMLVLNHMRTRCLSAKEQYLGHPSIRGRPESERDSIKSKVDASVSALHHYPSEAFRGYAICSALMRGMERDKVLEVFSGSNMERSIGEGRYLDALDQIDDSMNLIIGLREKRRNSNDPGSSETAASVNKHAEILLKQAFETRDFVLYANCMMDIQDSSDEIKNAFMGKTDFDASEIEDRGEGPDEPVDGAAGAAQRPSEPALEPSGGERQISESVDGKRTKRQKERRLARRRAELEAAEATAAPQADEVGEVESVGGERPESGMRVLQDEVDDAIQRYLESKRGKPADREGTWTTIRGRQNRALQTTIEAGLSTGNLKQRPSHTAELEGAKAGGAMIKSMNVKVKMYSGQGDEQKIYEHDYHDLAGNQWEHTTANGLGTYKNGKPTSKRASFDRAMDPRNNRGGTYVLVASGKGGYANKADIDHIRKSGGVVISRGERDGISVEEEIEVVAACLNMRRAAGA